MTGAYDYHVAQWICHLRHGGVPNFVGGRYPYYQVVTEYGPWNFRTGGE